MKPEDSRYLATLMRRPAIAGLGPARRNDFIVATASADSIADLPAEWLDVVRTAEAQRNVPLLNRFLFGSNDVEVSP